MLLVNWEHPGDAGFYKDQSHTRWKRRLWWFLLRNLDSHRLFLSSQFSRPGFLFFPLTFGILLSFLSMKDCCFGWVGSFPQILIWLSQLNFLFSSCCKLMRIKKVGSASLYQWKTVVPLVAPLSRHSGSSYETLLTDFPFFQIANFSAAFFLISFFLVASLLKDTGYLGSEMSSPRNSSWCFVHKLLRLLSQTLLICLFLLCSGFSSGDVLDAWKTWVGTPRIHENMKSWKTMGRE